MQDIGTSWKNRDVRSKLSFIVAIAWTLYTLAYLCNLFSYLHITIYSMSHRAVCAGLITILVFLLYPPKKGVVGRLAWYDILPILFTLAGSLYIIINGSRLVYEWGDANTPELVLGAIFILCLIEATRRTTGPVVTGLIIFFTLYTVYSNYFPGFLHSTGFSYSRMIGFMYLSAEGIWGMIIGVVSTVVAGFIIFGSFLNTTGAAKFYADLALATTGLTRGGAAKAAVIFSTLFGTLSGSIAANVATTGQITIPLMKRTGYDKNMAGAIEATASTGGMFMPPIMGAVAFLIAEFLGMSYWSVCIAAFIPAFIYYGVLFIQVDAEAGRKGLKGLPHEELPSLRKTLLSGWQFLLPLVLLVIFLGVLRYSATTSIMYTLGSLIVISLFKKESRPTPNRIVNAIEGSARGMLPIAPLCTAIGVIVGSLLVTGAGTSLTSALLNISGQSLMLMLIMAAGASFILGMGMTAVSCYILTVILMAPALITAGVEPIAAHMFLFYFGCLSFITPPVCIATYIASGISGGDPWSTGMRAMRLGVAAFLVPWAFIFSPGILAVGSGIDVLLSFTTTAFGAACVAIASAGYLKVELRAWQRVALALGGISMFVPAFEIKLAGFIIVGLMLLAHFINIRKVRLTSSQMAK